MFRGLLVVFIIQGMGVLVSIHISVLSVSAFMCKMLSLWEIVR